MFVARPIGEMVNTLPSQGNIHGFESHIGHHMLFKVPYLGAFLFNCGLKLVLNKIIVGVYMNNFFRNIYEMKREILLFIKHRSIELFRLLW